MTGGGFGGSAIALVPADSADVVAGAVRAAFAAAGHREPDIRATEPSAGAERVS
jgi:galactokinase